jgi:hypothetical protein
VNSHSRSVVFIFHLVGRQPSFPPLAVQHVRGVYMTPPENYHDGSRVFSLAAAECLLAGCCLPAG